LCDRSIPLISSFGLARRERANPNEEMRSYFVAFHPGLRPSAWSWAIIRPSFQDSGTGESQISRLQDAEDLTFRSFRIQTGCRCEIWVSLRQPSEDTTKERTGPTTPGSGIMVGYSACLTRTTGMNTRVVERIGITATGRYSLFGCLSFWPSLSWSPFCSILFRGSDLIVRESGASQASRAHSKTRSAFRETPAHLHLHGPG
jgi:hypothetical protein